MEAVASSVSPTVIVPGISGRPHRPPRCRRRRLFSIHRATERTTLPSALCSSTSSSSSSSLFSFPAVINRNKRWWWRGVASAASSMGEGGGEEEEGEAAAAEDEEVERALGMDGGIPGSPQEFLKRVSSRAYDMRRNLIQSIDSISYDVLETNPWRDDSKPVYVLTYKDNQLWTMKTRCSRSEVERELGLLFSKGGRRGLDFSNKSKLSRGGTSFHMLVEDIRDGVLVFEDEHEATRYCDLLEGGGQGCEGIAELEASSVFDICRRMRALAVLFRRGRTPPLPKSLEQNLRARKRSLEDQDIV